MALGFSSVSDMFAPYGQAWCRDHYWHYRMEQSDAKATGCTFAIIILTILLEVVMHVDFSSKPETPSSETNALGTEEADVELLPTSRPATPPPPPPPAPPSSHVVEKKRKEGPDPKIRATRFALGLMIYAGVMTAFIVRIRDAYYRPFVPEQCREEIGLDEPNWTAITFLAIIPFVCATFALLRAFVDCVLVRWGKSLGSFGSDTSAFPWPPCAPIVGVLFLAAVAFYMLFEFVRIPAALIMGKKEASMFTAGVARESRGADEERGGEEARGLVANVDGGEDAEGEGSGEPPAYEEAVGVKRGNGGGEKENV